MATAYSLFLWLAGLIVIGAVVTSMNPVSEFLNKFLGDDE